jgi:hypothetical protein
VTIKCKIAITGIHTTLYAGNISGICLCINMDEAGVVLHAETIIYSTMNGAI